MTMFDTIKSFLKKLNKNEAKGNNNSKEAAKERLHLVLMQDRANVSADFLELMKQEIIEVIKKYIDVDESAIDVRLTNKENEDGTNGAPALYANIPIINIKNEAKKVADKEKAKQEETKPESKGNENKDEITEEKNEENKEKENKEEVKQESKKEDDKKEDTTKKEGIAKKENAAQKDKDEMQKEKKEVEAKD